MYSGSSCDSGQMANGQSVCRPPAGPTANWLETQYRQQQHKKEDGEPVAIRVMTNGTGAPSERSDNYIGRRPFRTNQPEPTSPAHLAYLYERAQQPIKSPLTGMAVCPNGMVSVTSPHSDEYRSLSRAMPAPVQQQQQPSTAARTSSEASSDYNPFTRATPAPIQQHAQRPATISAGADAGTPTSPRATQPANAEPEVAEVTLILSLSVHFACFANNNAQWLLKTKIIMYSLQNEILVMCRFIVVVVPVSGISWSIVIYPGAGEI